MAVDNSSTSPGVTAQQITQVQKMVLDSLKESGTPWTLITFGLTFVILSLGLNSIRLFGDIESLALIMSGTALSIFGGLFAYLDRRMAHNSLPQIMKLYAEQGKALIDFLRGKW